jgi:predicted transcriptional regulator
MKHTSYSTVNKRVRSLEESGYVRKAAVKERPRGLTNYYELRPKVYLAKFLNSTNMENLIGQVNDETALAILGALIDAIEVNSRTE